MELDTSEFWLGKLKITGWLLFTARLPPYFEVLLDRTRDGLVISTPFFPTHLASNNVCVTSDCPTTSRIVGG
jgi:hypothetical protein